MTPDELKHARKNLGWSQARLAGVLGVARNTLNRWEMGIYPIHPAAAQFVRHLLECDHR